VIVNLIDHKKGEGDLERHFRSLHQASGLNEVEYVAFDFHQVGTEFAKFEPFI
jgi:hypothetical protein